jgi:asparagine synthase (glutamine-hydrolysing)
LRRRYTLTTRRLDKLARCLGAASFDGVYTSMMSHWNQPEELVPGAKALTAGITDPDLAFQLPDATSNMAFLDLVTYLPDDILTKVDRASMAVSLEARVPLLDHRVVEFALRLPPALRTRTPEPKKLLRDILYKFVPQELNKRPKQGFDVPVGEWLRGPLRDWAESLLDPSKVRQAGVLDSRLIQEVWQDHITGRADGVELLWDVLMFQSWFECSTRTTCIAA